MRRLSPRELYTPIRLRHGSTRVPQFLPPASRFHPGSPIPSACVTAPPGSSNSIRVRHNSTRVPQCPLNQRHSSTRVPQCPLNQRHSSTQVTPTPRCKTFSGCLHTPVLNPPEADFSIRCACNQAKACRLKGYTGERCVPTEALHRGNMYTGGNITH